jgi:hypothetical protein
MLARFAIAGLFSFLGITTLLADDAAEKTVSVAEGKLSFAVPEGWEKTQPRSRIVEMEFTIPSADGDESPGRLTVMGAGGLVEANIDRWLGQFQQPDGTDTSKVAKIEKLKVGGHDVHYVDVSGTYRDMPGGPFAGGKAVLRDDYRMLAAIIETDKAGNYFFKLYGPKKTIAENEKSFRGLVNSLKTK